jgi:hypothetical protein
MRALALAALLLLAACAPKEASQLAAPSPRPAVTARIKKPAHIAIPLPRPRPAVVGAPAPVQQVPLAPASSAPPPAPVERTTAHEFVPVGAVKYAPILAGEQRLRWADAPVPWTLGGLVEQESCVSLKSPRCWNPRAELKTYREYGFGFGQITIAYNADRSERFNEFTELQKKYASLRGWQWSARFDPAHQLVAVVEMTHTLWRQVPPAADDDTRWAFALASYNGGLGALLQDRRVCANAGGCDPRLWFGNIETHSLKSRAPQKAYGGQSWFSINRGYVRNVLKSRRAKYRQFWS